MAFTASDLADWFDEWGEDYWVQQDDWLIEAQRLGDAHPVIVFAGWFGNRISTAPNRLQHFLTGTVVDVLRLGADIDTDLRWGIAKGAFFNLTRLAVVAGPAAKALVLGARHAGLVATATLDGLQGVSSPCRFVSVNNALSFLRGKPVQLFGLVDDMIVKVRPGAPGANMIDEILKHPYVAPLIKDAGVVWKDLGNMASVSEAVAKARQVEGALVIGVEWVRAGKPVAHRITLVKNAWGEVKMLDYTDGASFRGFASLREMAARPNFDGFENAIIRPSVLLFQSKYLKLLEFGGNTWKLGLPVALGVHWTRGGKNQSFADAAPAIAKSVSDYLDKKLGDKAPPLPESLYPPPTRPPEMVSLMYTHTVEGPRIEERDWLSNIAKKWYGDMLLWPILFEFNKGPDFTNQNKMYVGQRVKVPFITDKTPAEIAAYRKRGLNWR